MKISLFIIVFLLSPFAFSNFVFQPDGCEYSVKFPRKPTFQTLSTEYYGQYQVAAISNDEFFLKAECMKIIDKLSAEDRKRGMVLYAQNNGIQYPSFEQSSGSLGQMNSMRGSKIIANKPVTVGVVIYYGQSSFLSIQVGALSHIYPTKEIIRFLDSVTH